jgi:hypothetical protein
MTITPSLITAVVVTRGNVDITPVLHSLRGQYPFFGDVIIYDNSKLLDFRVFSRFLAAQLVQTPYAYVQDDDCIVDLSRYPWHLTEAGKILCNMPAAYRPNYPGLTQLLGFGSVFHRDLIRPTFERYFSYLEYDWIIKTGQVGLDLIFLLECDRLFTSLNICKLVDVPITHLPHATAPDRLYLQPDHAERRKEIERRIKLVLEDEKRKD